MEDCVIHRLLQTATFEFLGTVSDQIEPEGRKDAEVELLQLGIAFLSLSSD